MTVVLKNNDELEGARKDFRGAPSDPMTPAEFDAKFLALTGSISAQAPRLLDRLRRLDEV
jgi:hypothetical protein